MATMNNNNGDDLERLIALANKVAKPYLITVWVLSVLLILSLGANIYLAAYNAEITIEQTNDNSDHNNNGIRK